MKKMVTAMLVGIASGMTLTGCSSSSRSRAEMEPYDAMATNEQGVQTGVWEPPMVDVIQVPPGLDPEGHYYRPAHDEIVEIRQGRWKVEGNDKKGR